MATDACYSDPVLDELHAIRRDMLAECGGDLEGLVAAIQKRESESDRVIARKPAEEKTVTERRH